MSTVPVDTPSNPQSTFVEHTDCMYRFKLPESNITLIRLQSASLVLISPARMFPARNTTSGLVEEQEEELHLHRLPRPPLPLLLPRRHLLVP